MIKKLVKKHSLQKINPVDYDNNLQGFNIMYLVTDNQEIEEFEVWIEKIDSESALISLDNIQSEKLLELENLFNYWMKNDIKYTVHFEKLDSYGYLIKKLVLKNCWIKTMYYINHDTDLLSDLKIRLKFENLEVI